MPEKNILIMHLEPPDDEDGIPLSLKLIRFTPELVAEEDRTRLKLPFPLEKIPFLLRALNARQYPDYPRNERLIQTDDDRNTIIPFLCDFDLWDRADHSLSKAGVVVDVHKKVGLLFGNALQALPAFKKFHQTLYEAGTGEIVFSFDPHPHALSLALLPWEATYMPDTQQPMLFTMGAVLGCTRILAHDNTHLVPKPRGERLRILTIAPRAGMDDAGYAFEQLARGYMRDQLRSLADIEALPHASMRSLYERLEKGSAVDILDFYGHGIPTSEGPAILMDGDRSGIDPVPAVQLQTLANLLPPVVVLHSCQPPNLMIDSPLANIAVALSAAGVRAVFAMQLTTQMPAVTHFSIPKFYEQLAAGESLQRAVAEVRRVLHTVERSGTSWYLPALYLRQKEMLHPFILRGQAEAPPNPFAGLGALRNPRLFIGRAPQVRRLWDRLKAGGSLSIIGPAESGKSCFLKLIATEARTYIGQNIEVIELPVSSRLEEMKADLAYQLGGEGSGGLLRLLRGKQLILLLDDLGELEQNEEGLKVRKWLRSLANAIDNQVVQLVATSKTPLSEGFASDKPTNSTTLASTLSDFIELKPLEWREAQLFIETALTGTPFKLEQFVDALNGPLLPGLLQKRCREHYDRLSEERNW